MQSFFTREAFELVAVDRLDLTESLNHRRHVIVAVDVFTRFVFGKAIKNLRGSTFVKFLLETFGRFGVPKQLLTDNAPVFRNEQIEELASRFKFHHRFLTPHHHEGNAIAKRMIQTVQEKLAILVNRQDVNLDWEMSLPQAFLSINTAVCASTGFSPYELLFGRKYNVFGLDFELRDAQIEQYLNQKHDRLAEVTREANDRQLAAKAKSKTRFDSAHVPVSFEVGDLVWTRKMGRLQKLSNRWDGPLVVKSKSNDIYQLYDGTSKKIVERHVSDMKAFRATSSILTAIFLSHVVSSQLVFERAPPVLWQDTERYVSKGITHVKLQFSVASLCPVLLEVLPSKDDGQGAFERCQRVYQEHIVNRFGRFNEVVAAAFKQLKHHSKAEDKRNSVPQHQSGAPPGAVMLPPKHQQWPSGIPQGHQIGKRGISSVLSGLATASSVTGDFATYAIIGNVVQTVLERFWPNRAVVELQESQRDLQDSLARLVSQLNATQLGLDACHNAIINQATITQHHTAELEYVRFGHPQLMVVYSHIVAKMVVMGLQLDQIRTSFRNLRPDLQQLSVLLDLNEFDDMDPKSINRNSVRATLIDVSTLLLEFSGHVRDPDTRVYAVETFSFWTNLTEDNPKLLRYEGPEFLIFNASNQCVHGISAPKNRHVNAKCVQANHEDTSLANWVPVITSVNPWRNKLHTAVEESYPFVYVYCFPHNISAGGLTGECPPFVHRINATEAFVTSDGYEYSPSAVELNTGVELVTTKVHSIHFRNHSMILSENQALKALYATKVERDKLKDQLYAFRFKEGGGLSKFSVLAAIVGSCMALGGNWYLHHWTMGSHRELRRIVTDSIYGQRVYDDIQLRPLPRGSGSTGRAQVNVNFSVPTCCEVILQHCKIDLNMQVDNGRS